MPLAARLRDRLASRSNRPLVLLLACLAAVGVAGFEAQRAVRSNHTMAEELLRDYARFAAWSYGQSATARLDSTLWAILGPVMHEFPHQGEIPHPAVLVHYRPYDEREEEHQPWPYPPSLLFGYTLGADTLWAVRNALGDPHRGWRVDSLAHVSPGERALARDSVLAHLRAHYGRGQRYALFQAAADGERRMVGYTLMPTEWGDTVLYGFVLDRADYTALLRDLHESRPLLPAAVTGEHPNPSVLAVGVASHDSIPIWISDPSVRLRFYGDETLPAALGGLRVRAAVRPERAGQLVIGGLPRSRLPFLAGLLALAGGLAVVAAGQLRREGELARLRSDFVASVSHELRTPLAQVRLFVETLVLGRARTDQQRRWALENIDRETTRLAHLVENVLLVSRAARGGAPVALSPADVGAEVRQAVDAFAPLAAARRAELRADLAEGIVAPLHRESFRQVLTNLLDNAVKYGPPGQTVRVAVRREGDGVRVEVADQGPGVPAAEREAVWKPFFRGGGPAVRAVGGSGIGLSVVRDLVARHGGRAWVEDAPGGGACFVIRLPLSSAAADAGEAPAPLPAPAAAGAEG